MLSEQGRAEGEQLQHLEMYLFGSILSASTLVNAGLNIMSTTLLTKMLWSVVIALEAAVTALSN